MLKILMISPAFAPFSGVGAVRMTSLAKYLSARGDSVTVMRYIPSIWGNATLKTIQPDGIEYIDVAPKSPGNYAAFDEDAEIMKAAYVQLLERHAFDVAIVSCGPFCTLSYIPLLFQKYHLPYIIDFRDLWVYSTVFRRGLKQKLFLNRYKQIERQAIRYSFNTLCVTDADLKSLQCHYPKYRNKFSSIMNGYDDTAFHTEHVARTSKEIRIAVFGKLSYYNPQMAECFLRGVKQVISTRPETITFWNIGEEDQQTDSIIKEIGFPMDRFVSTGFIDYAAGIDLLSDSDICGVVRGDFSGLGTKVFDYIAVNKPIISVAPCETEFTEFVRRFPNAFVCHDTESVVSAINKILDEKISSLCEDQELINSYSRTNRNREIRAMLVRASGITEE